MPTDFSEAGLELLITADLTSLSVSQLKVAESAGAVGELPVGYDADGHSGISSVTTAPLP
jgi:hypothetical protein